MRPAWRVPGAVATALMQRETLWVGDSLVARDASGKICALINLDSKTRIKKAGPSTSGRIVGISGVLEAGDVFVVPKDEQTTRELAVSRVW